MKLRKWQHEAVSLAVSQYRSGKSHFLCLATPGAGKTFMAATVAQRLLRNGDIDLVFCFSPSVNVANSFLGTLESVLGQRLDGRLGSRGKVITYQSMLNIDQSFWSLLKTHRTLIIFDEIHHCAGDNLANANAWGQKIIHYIQGHATFTLALTGTPWRSDRIPIALSTYCHESKVHCDFKYGLTQAIQDGVCRVPKITVVDNEKIMVKTESGEDQYSSFGELLKLSKCTYQQLIESTALIRYIIDLSTKKLNLLRMSNTDAGGLVVAASVEHALQIAEIFQRDYGEDPQVVTYLHDDSQQVIRQFRETNTKWIISVGMISEGTDIPRLRVCCHLTRVKTELYFRQILGRILRAQNEKQDEAFLLMPAEPNLISFAERVAEDIPSTNTISLITMKENLEPSLIDHTEPEALNDTTTEFSNESDRTTDQIESKSEVIFIGEKEDDLAALPFTSLSEAYETTIGLFGRFRKRMIRFSAVIG